MRAIAIVRPRLHVIVLLSPPLQLTDLFNYLGYARLGALHHLNPYTHVIKQEIFDPVYRFTSWHNLSSPYGPLFTAISYPWRSCHCRSPTGSSSSPPCCSAWGFVGLIWQLRAPARAATRGSRRVRGLQPVFLVYEMAGSTTTSSCSCPSMGAISLLLARRDRPPGRC